MVEDVTDYLMRLEHASTSGPIRQGETLQWREEAACRGHDPDLFFPGSEPTPGDIAAAKAICATCSVLGECLTYALETNQTEGIWGGETPTGRRKLRRRWLEETRRAS